MTFLFSLSFSVISNLNKLSLCVRMCVCEKEINVSRLYRPNGGAGDCACVSQHIWA